MTRRLRDQQNSWAKQPLKMYDDPFPSRLQLHLPGVHDDDDDGTVLETLVGISPIAWIIRFRPRVHVNRCFSILRLAVLSSSFYRTSNLLFFSSTFLSHFEIINLSPILRSE